MTNPKSDTPCLPGCRTIEAAHYDSDHVPSCPNAFRPNAEAHKCDCGADDFNARNLSEGDRRVPHALNCPKRPNAEVPKEMDMDLPRIGMRKPAPAPEPKQGSVDNSVFTASQAAYLSMEREREALRAEVERLRRLILQAGARENGLKADLQLATEELAAAKEEIAKLRVDLPYCTMPYHKELNKWYGDALKERDAARDDRDSNLKTHNTVMRELGQQLAAERAAREKAEKEWDYFDRRATEAKARVRELAKAAQAVVDVRPDLPNTLRGEIESLAAILANRKKEESNG